MACAGLFFDSRPLDFDVYMTGGRALWDGIDLYSPAVHVRQYGFTYPPFAAMLFALPAQLAFTPALLVMSLVSLASLAAIIWLSAPALVRSAVRSRSLRAAAAIAAMIACEPVRATIWDGQVNLLLAALVMLDFIALRTSTFRGILTGIAIAIKLTPAIFVLYLLLRRRFRAAALALVTFGATILIGWLVAPGDSSQYWLHNLYNGSGIGDEAKASNIRGALLRLMGDTPALVLWLLLSAGTLVIGFAYAIKASERGHEAYALGIVGIVGCLISPVTWTHHWVWCIPWLVGLYEVVRRRGRAAAVSFGVLVFVYLALNVVPPRISAKAAVSHFLSSNALVLTAVAVALAALWTRPSRKAGPSAAS